MRDPIKAALAPFRLHVGGQLVRLAEEAAASTMLRSFPLVVRHASRLALRAGSWAADTMANMARATKLTKSEVDRRRAAAERMRGLFADVAPGRSLVDELIADRRAEAAAEGRESAARRRRNG